MKYSLLRLLYILNRYLFSIMRHTDYLIIIAADAIDFSGVVKHVFSGFPTAHLKFSPPQWGGEWGGGRIFPVI